MNKILILFSAIILFNFDCSSDSNNIRMQNENNLLRYRLDSLANGYDILNEKYTNIKNKPPDTVYIFSQSDSINWIDSIKYTFRDSLVFIPHDTTIVNLIDSVVLVPHDTLLIQYKDSLVLIPYDTLIINIKDSIVYNFRDSLLYKYKDSIIISYDERTFPEESIEKYLNLFFKTDNINDTAGIKYNFSILDNRRKSYILNENYSVPDSITGWRLEWYLKKSKVKSQMSKIVDMNYGKEK